MTLDIDSIREIVRSEIPRALSEDPEVRRAIWLVARNEFADKRKTEGRFDIAHHSGPTKRCADSGRDQVVDEQGRHGHLRPQNARVRITAQSSGEPPHRDLAHDG